MAKQMIVAHFYFEAEIDGDDWDLDEVAREEIAHFGHITPDEYEYEIVEEA
jgi:hypothetical protein